MLGRLPVLSSAMGKKVIEKKDRNIEMAKRHLLGEKLKVLAKDYNITSPCVRLIIVREVEKCGFRASNSNCWLQEARTDAYALICMLGKCETHDKRESVIQKPVVHAFSHLI